MEPLVAPVKQEDVGDVGEMYAVDFQDNSMEQTRMSQNDMMLMMPQMNELGMLETEEEGWGAILDDIFDAKENSGAMNEPYARMDPFRFVPSPEERIDPCSPQEYLSSPTLSSTSKYRTIKPKSSSRIKGQKEVDLESKSESDLVTSSHSSDGGNPEGELEGEEDGTLKKERNREACRRHRQKKRKEMESLRLKRSQLEKERSLFLSRIAELQTEVEALRYGGSVDLAKENYLLRAEIIKHKVFVQNIIDATRQNTPTRRTPEEQLRMIRNGIESAKRQVTGLGYSSAADPSWKICQPLPRLDRMPGTPDCFFKYQHMPIGSDCYTATRINLRVDLLNLPISAKAVSQLFLEMVAHPEKFDYHHKAKAARLGVEVAMENILPQSLREIATQMGEGESLHVHRFSETKTTKDGMKMTNEAILALESGLSQVAVPAIFRKDHIESGLLGADVDICGFSPAYIGCSTTCHGAFDSTEFSSNARASTAAMLKGHIVIPTGPQSCHFISLSSHPISPDSFKTLEDASQIIDVHGKVCDSLLEGYRDLRKLFLTEGIKFQDES